MKSLSKTIEPTQSWWKLWSSLCPCSADSKRTDSVNKSAATREKILLAAFDEMYHCGFQAASLNNILKNTGTTKGALYHHFKNKMDLGYAVVDEFIFQSIKENWIEPLNQTDDPIKTIQDILINTSQIMTDADIRLGCPMNNLAQEMSPIDEGFRERISKVYSEWQEAIEAACERGKLAGNFKNSVDSKQASVLFVASLEGCLGYAKSLQSKDALLSCGQGLIDQLESLRPRKKT
ncbi:TetR/AcrR family transcriptional regulator [uncultured Cocleimonas sp.]|uniref:TetR/AcrR family transcriptional regulator n=1 Tax=uncultured Cocleimonas sp. TaxID=1051587 RepID=UPI00260C4268|nr:TetR/AcrR family transcriptional regulator [uncultured Cocleimonas sp.]